MIKQYLEAGKVTSTHGVRGEVRIETWTNSPEFLCGFKTLYINGNPMKVLTSRPHKSAVVVLFDGIDSIDGAAGLKNRVVLIDRNDAGLEPGEHFISDLVGMTAVDEVTGKELGRVSEVIPLTPNNVYVITGQREILIPAVPEFVKEINVEAGRILFRLIEGM